MTAMKSQRSQRNLQKGRSQRNLQKIKSRRHIQQSSIGDDEDKEELNKSKQRSNRRESHKTVTSTTSERRRSRSGSERLKSKRRSNNNNNDNNKTSAASGEMDKPVGSGSAVDRKEATNGSEHGRRRSSSKHRRTTNIEKELRSEASHSSSRRILEGRSTSVGPTGRRRRSSNSSKPKSSSRREKGNGMSQSEVVGRSRHSSSSNNMQMSTSEIAGRTRHSSSKANDALNRSLSSAEPLLAQHNKRPASRRESAKRHSVRSTNNWLVGGKEGSTSSHRKSGRRRASRLPDTQEENMNDEDDDKDDIQGVLQINVHRDDTSTDKLTMGVSVTKDPSTLSHKVSEKEKDIYALGVLSPSHLEKQPDKISPTETPSAGGSPGEIVKVQFIQSGGKVIKVNAPQAPKTPTDHSSGHSQKNKNLLTSLAKNLLPASAHGNSATPGRKKRVSAISKIAGSRYRNFSGSDNTDHDDIDEANKDKEEKLSGTVNPKWKKVDAAIPVLHL